MYNALCNYYPSEQLGGQALKEEQFKVNAASAVKEVLDTFDMENCFQINNVDVLNNKRYHKDRISGYVVVNFTQQNCTHQHNVYMGWCRIAGFGLENNEGDITPFTHTEVLRSLYLDLALTNLNPNF